MCKLRIITFALKERDSCSKYHTKCFGGQVFYDKRVAGKIEMQWLWLISGSMFMADLWVPLHVTVDGLNRFVPLDMDSWVTKFERVTSCREMARKCNLFHYMKQIE